MMGMAMAKALGMAIVMAVAKVNSFFKGVYKMSEYVVFMNMALFISATVMLVMAALTIYTQDSTKRLVYGILLCIFAAVIATLLVRKSML